MRDTNLSNRYNFVPGDTARKLEKLKNQNTINIQQNQRGNINYNTNQNINTITSNPTPNANPNTNPISPNLKSSSINNIMNNDPIMKDQTLSPNATSNKMNINSGFGNIGSSNNFKATNINMGGGQTGYGAQGQGGGSLSSNNVITK
jgi:hypothetical protein